MRRPLAQAVQRSRQESPAIGAAVAVGNFDEDVDDLPLRDRVCKLLAELGALRSPGDAVALRVERADQRRDLVEKNRGRSMLRIEGFERITVFGVGRTGVLAKEVVYEVVALASSVPSAACQRATKSAAAMSGGVVLTAAG